MFGLEAAARGVKGQTAGIAAALMRSYIRWPSSARSGVFPYRRASAGGTVLWRLLIRLGAKASVQYCRPHRFRHTFEVNFLRNGGNAFELKMALGRTTLQMVQTYLALAQADLRLRSGQAWTRRTGRHRRWRIGDCK